MLERILNSKKIRYEILNRDLNKYVPKDIEEVNIFIDVWSIINSLYNPNVMETFTSLNVNEKYMISSELLNLAGHYRHYFASRHKKYTNIYYYFSDEKCSAHIEKCDKYKESFYNKRLL